MRSSSTINFLATQIYGNTLIYLYLYCISLFTLLKDIRKTSLILHFIFLPNISHYPLLCTGSPKKAINFQSKIIRVKNFPRKLKRFLNATLAMTLKLAANFNFRNA